MKACCISFRDLYTFLKHERPAHGCLRYAIRPGSRKIENHWRYRITKSTSKLKWALIDEEAGVCAQNPSNRYNQTFFYYAGRPSWSDHCQHRSGQGQEIGRASCRERV